MLKYKAVQSEYRLELRSAYVALLRPAPYLAPEAYIHIQQHCTLDVSIEY